VALEKPWTPHLGGAPNGPGKSLTQEMVLDSYIYVTTHFSTPITNFDIKHQKFFFLLGLDLTSPNDFSSRTWELESGFGYFYGAYS
jgi:hypothetical protein